MRMTRAAALHSEINVTPLVDVCLVLLIIFMVVMPLIAGGRAERRTSASAQGIGPSVIVRADKTLPYGDVMKVLDACRTAGFAQVGLAGVPPS